MGSEALEGRHNGADRNVTQVIYSLLFNSQLFIGALLGVPQQKMVRGGGKWCFVFEVKNETLSCFAFLCLFAAKF